MWHGCTHTQCLANESAQDLIAKHKLAPLLPCWQGKLELLKWYLVSQMMPPQQVNAACMSGHPYAVLQHVAGHALRCCVRWLNGPC